MGMSRKTAQIIYFLYTAGLPNPNIIQSQKVTKATLGSQRPEKCIHQNACYANRSKDQKEKNKTRAVNYRKQPLTHQDHYNSKASSSPQPTKDQPSQPSGPNQMPQVHVWNGPPQQASS